MTRRGVLLSEGDNGVVTTCLSQVEWKINSLYQNPTMKQSQDRLCRYSNIMYEVVGMYRLIKKIPLRKKRELESERGDLTRLFFHDVSILLYQFTFQHCALISQYNHNIIFLYPFINALTLKHFFPLKSDLFVLQFYPWLVCLRDQSWIMLFFPCTARQDREVCNLLISETS